MVPTLANILFPPSTVPSKAKGVENLPP